MSAHAWKNTVPSRCNRCGATRVAVRPAGTHPHYAGLEDRGKTRSPYDYALPDGLGAVSTRPACGKGQESRHSRRMGRRAKRIAASRAGGKRLRTKETIALLAKLFADRPALDVLPPEVPEGLAPLVGEEPAEPSPAASTSDPDPTS